MLSIRARVSGPASQRTGRGLVLSTFLVAGLTNLVVGCAGGSVRQTGNGTGNAGSGSPTGTGAAGTGSNPNPGTAGTGANPGTAGDGNTGVAGDGSNPGTAGASGSTGAAGVTGAAGATGLGGSPGPCMATNTNKPQLPAAFYPMCSTCHSAFGPSANPLVPNLFTFAADAATTKDAFTAIVRAGKPGTIMVPFTAAQVSDADVGKIYDYFKAGQTSGVETCPGEGGTVTANEGACSGMAISYAPLFTNTQTAAQPIAYTDATTKHLMFRGAGRVRFRHEMEDTFAIYHDHYFEDRTFAYILDDSIPAGGTTITVTFLPVQNQFYSKQTLAGQQQGGADLNIRAWKIYGGVDGNAFAANAGGASNNVLPTNCATDPNSANCDTRKYTYVINRNDREGRAIKAGDQLQIEFGIFLARYPSALGTNSHVRNILPLPNGCTLNGAPYNNACYTQANYYSDSFRYVVGKGTVTPENQDCTMSVPPAMENSFPKPYDCSPNGAIAKAAAAGMFPNMIGPVEAGWSAGSMTQPYLRWRHDLYLSQMGPAILGENAQNFVQGRRLFHTNYTTGQHIEANNGLQPDEVAVHANMAGPLLNQLSCEGCHSHNNRGFPPAAGMPFDSVVVKINGTGTDAHGNNNPDPNYGRQLQDKSTGSVPAEGKASFTFATVTRTFGDGTSYSLSKPSVTFSGMTAGAPTNYSVRLARPLVGMGLLEAIPEADLLAHADPTDCNGDGIKGVPNLVFDPEDNTTKIGRMGWKASKASVRMQVAEALNLDIGVTSSVYPKHDCGSAQTACTAADTGKPEMSDDDLNRLVTYMRTLAVPARRDLANPQVVRGETLFNTLGCSTCHQPNQHTGTATPFLELQNQVIHPYSDLLLHDMGTDLADNSAQPEYKATATMWRTPPLWTIGLCDEVAQGFQQDQTLNPAPNQGPCHYLHDGRAATLLEAVLWHGGEAEAVRKKVEALPVADRNALVSFLKSL